MRGFQNMNKQKFDSMTDREKMNCEIEGTFYYASVHSPNTAAARKFNADPYFCVNVGLDKENLKKAKDLGLTIKEPTDNIPEKHTLIKRKIKEGRTADEVKPIVVDGTQELIPSSVMIGNGSRGICKFGIYWWDNNGGGIGTNLFKVQVLDFVQYVPPADPALKMDENAFSISDFLGTTPEASNDTPEESTPDDIPSAASVFDD